MTQATLLSGKKVEFRAPTKGDIKEAKRFAEMKKENSDEVLAMSCLTAVSSPTDTDTMVDTKSFNEANPVRVGEAVFSVKESQNYVTLFFAREMLTDDEVEKIRDYAKTL